MIIMWTGTQTRENSYGTFEANKPQTVPDAIARELLTNNRFVEVSADGELGAQAVERIAATTPVINDVLKQMHALEDSNADLRLQLAKYEEAEASVDATPAEDDDYTETVEGSPEIQEDPDADVETETKPDAPNNVDAY